MQYFIHHDNQQLGPFTEGEVKAKLASGEITTSDHVWWEGQQGWVPLGQTPLAGAPSAPTGPIIPGTSAAAAYQAAPAAKTTSQLAIWALVCGCVGLLCGFAAIPAIILGHMGLSETKKNPALQGRGMALAGMIMGYIVTALIIAYLIFVFAIAGLAMKEAINQQSDSSTSTNSVDQTTNSTPAAPQNK